MLYLFGSWFKKINRRLQCLFICWTNIKLIRWNRYYQAILSHSSNPHARTYRYPHKDRGHMCSHISSACPSPFSQSPVSFVSIPNLRKSPRLHSAQRLLRLRGRRRGKVRISRHNKFVYFVALYGHSERLSEAAVYIRSHSIWSETTSPHRATVWYPLCSM